MPYTISAVGTLGYSTGSTSPANTQLSVSPASVGNVLVLGTEVVSTTISVSSISGGGVTTWTRLVGPFLNAANRNMELWFGRVTTAGAATLTMTHSASVSGIRVDRGVQEFTSTGATDAVWTQDGTGGTNTGTGATVQYPTLTPSGSNRLYFGYAYLEGVSAGGPTAGYTEQLDASGNSWMYNANVSGAQSPTTTQTAQPFSAVSALLSAEPSVPPVVDPLRLPIQIIQVP